MSEFKRLTRLLKSRIPRFPRKAEDNYSLSDARMIITDLGMQMSPEALQYLTNDDALLEDFLENIYHLEERVGRKVITEYATINTEFEPKVYEENGELGFSVIYGRKELVYAEYRLPGASDPLDDDTRSDDAPARESGQVIDVEIEE
ncbi:MAG: hypothetical protein AAFR61_27030 [Bacteroidota bacterium]